MTYNPNGSYIVLSADSALQAERVLVAGPGISLTDGGPGGNLTISSDSRSQISTHSEFYDFLNAVNGTPFTATASGSGAAVSAASGGWSRPGVVKLSTGSTSSGKAAISTASSAILFGNGGGLDFEASVYLTATSNSSQRYQLRIGAIDTLTGDQTDGVYFEYDDSLSSSWRIATANNSTRTKLATSVAVSTSSWISLRLVVNSSGTKADFYINGNLVGTITTNIPTAVGRETGLGILITKSVGSSASTLNVDSVYFQLDNPNL
jgi:hypothetical protein